MEWYMKGFNDELKGTSSIESDNELENRAYLIGAVDAIAEDSKKLDKRSKEEILKQIKNT